MAVFIGFGRVRFSAHVPLGDLYVGGATLIYDVPYQSSTILRDHQPEQIHLIDLTPNCATNERLIADSVGQGSYLLSICYNYVQITLSSQKCMVVYATSFTCP